MNVLLPVNMQPQARSNWCWAAVASSTGTYLRAENPAGALSQCEVANAILQLANCCADPDSCNVTAGLDDALQVVGHLNDQPFDGVATFDSIRTLTSPPYNVPVGVRVANGADGHFLLIVGFLDDDGRQWIHTVDPLYGPGTYDINDFASSYQGASWTNTYSID